MHRLLVVEKIFERYEKQEGAAESRYRRMRPFKVLAVPRGVEKCKLRHKDGREPRGARHDKYGENEARTEYRDGNAPHEKPLLPHSAHARKDFCIHDGIVKRERRECKSPFAHERCVAAT